MHGAPEFLQSLAIVFCVAGLTTVVFQKLRQPVVFGYLIAGMIVGPHIPIPLVADPDTINTLSELGVILLMFFLGLEFSLRKLLRVGPTAGVVALIQSSFMIWLGYEAGRLFGWPPLESFYAGAVLAISSTTIIVSAFGEHGIKGKFTEIVFGILIVEDLIGILLIAILTAVSSGTAVSARELAVTGGRLAAFLAGLLLVGMLTVPRLVRVVVRLNRPETTLVASVGICFACALLARTFGYSVALGAFLAGALVAESGVEKRIERLVKPLCDAFAAVFFVSVGMLIDPLLIGRHWIPVVVFLFLVVAGKVVGVTFGTFLAGYGVRTSVQAGMSLAQIGEFSFIIAALGLSSGATRDFLYPVAVTVSAATTLLTPWMIRWSAPVATRIDRRLPKPLRTFAALYGAWLEKMRQRGEPEHALHGRRRRVRMMLIDLALVLCSTDRRVRVEKRGRRVDRLPDGLLHRYGPIRVSCRGRPPIGRLLLRPRPGSAAAGGFPRRQGDAAGGAGQAGPGGGPAARPARNIADRNRPAGRNAAAGDLSAVSARFPGGGSSPGGVAPARGPVLARRRQPGGPREGGVAGHRRPSGETDGDGGGRR